MTDTPLPPSSRDSDAPPDWEVLARYQAGESPEPEARAVSAWLAAHPGDAKLLARLDAVLAATVAGVPDAGDDAAADVDVEAALRRVHLRRDAEREVVDRGTAGPAASDVLPFRRRPVPSARGATRDATRPPARASRYVVGGGLAAAAAIAAIAVGLARRGDGGTPAPGSAGSVMTTAVGVRDSLRLPDGTGVVLAPGSRLAVAADYGASRREVTLDGAAIFRVRHDAAREFAVRAGGAVVRDVGTTFAVRTDGVDGPSGVAVSVTEGAVALRAASPASAGDTGVVLGAGDRGELHADGRVVAARGAATDDDVAWARGRLAYDAAPLDVVRADLRRWYGVDLRVADSTLARRRLTASFDGEPVARVLDVVALALGATVERNGNVAVLRAAAVPTAAQAGAPAKRSGGTR